MCANLQCLVCSIWTPHHGSKWVVEEALAMDGNPGLLCSVLQATCTPCSSLHWTALISCNEQQLCTYIYIYIYSYILILLH